MVSPVTLDGISLHHTTMSVLPELCMGIGLELDDVCAIAVLHAKHLHVDGTDPMIPASILLAIDVNVWRAIFVGKLVLLELILVDAVCAVLWRRSVDILREVSNVDSGKFHDRPYLVWCDR